MGKKVHAVTVGTETFTRESDSRTYTHAVVVTRTRAEVDANVARATAERDRHTTTVATLEPAASAPGAAEAYAAARGPLDHLEELVHEEQRGDRPPGLTQRWLSRAYRAEIGELAWGAERPAGYDPRTAPSALTNVNAARSALHATAVQKLADARQQLAIAESALQHQLAKCVGEVTCENWSQSATGAAKLAGDVLKHRPLADVRVTDQVSVRTRATRTK